MQTGGPVQLLRWAGLADYKDHLKLPSQAAGVNSVQLLRWAGFADYKVHLKLPSQADPAG